MLNKISTHLHSILDTFSINDALMFKNKLFPIQQSNFSTITKSDESKLITFIDGGQAEILNSSNFCVSFIRIVGVTFVGMQKKDMQVHEFYVVTNSLVSEEKTEYISKIFTLKGENLVDEHLLRISSNDVTIRSGNQRAPIEKVANMARRFAEINLAKKITQLNQNKNGFVLLDGTLEATYQNEVELLQQLPINVCALAKTCSLMTQNGNNPVVLFSTIGPKVPWKYFVEEKTHFVQLHERSKHIFRFEGNVPILSSLLEHSTDSLFVGYPYGLVFVDKLARITNKEKDAQKMQFLLNKNNSKIAAYVHATNAHDILDSMG
jgi:hypothetical protein